MAEPWREASELMQEYSLFKGFEWPGYSANDLIARVKIRDRRWTDGTLEDEADCILSWACFDADDLATNYLGIEIIQENLEYLDPYADSPVYGYAKPAAWSIAVCKRAKGYFPLYRATVMHEIAHLLMHAVERPRVLTYAPEAKRRPSEEREADQFMHVCLLPRPVLNLAIARFSDVWRLNVSEVIRTANTKRGRWQWRYRILPLLVNRLAVSREMICIKLMRMGVMNADTLRYHQSYQMPNRWLRPETARPLRKTIEDCVSQFL